MALSPLTFKPLYLSHRSKERFSILLNGIQMLIATPEAQFLKGHKLQRRKMSEEFGDEKDIEERRDKSASHALIVNCLV